MWVPSSLHDSQVRKWLYMYNYAFVATLNSNIDIVPLIVIVSSKQIDLRDSSRLVLTWPRLTQAVIATLL